MTNFTHQLKMTYNHLEHWHKKYGLVLHGSIFVFSFLLGMSLGILILFVKITQEKQNMLTIKKYENQIMTQLVKRIEAAPPTLPNSILPSKK